VNPDSPIKELTNPREAIIQLIDTSREMVIRNNPKVLALFILLNDYEQEEHVVQYLANELIDIEGFYMDEGNEGSERPQLLDQYFWETPPDNIDVARSRVWDCFQAYNKKFLALAEDIGYDEDDE
jgi:hypothetical protein